MNSNSRAGKISRALVEQIWKKAEVPKGADGKIYRKDRFGSWIQKEAFGTRDELGWEIDVEGAEPLHWKNREMIEAECVEDSMFPA